MQVIEQNARTLFMQALDQPVEDWPAFVEQACGGDVDLKLRTERLLRAHVATGSIHVEDIDALAPTHRQGMNSELLETTIGPYKLREVLGEGGMGIVYAAEQEHPVRRKVALKVIKPGMDTLKLAYRYAGRDFRLTDIYGEVVHDIIA